MPLQLLSRHRLLPSSKRQFIRAPEFPSFSSFRSNTFAETKWSCTYQTRRQASLGVRCRWKHWRPLIVSSRCRVCPLYSGPLETRRKPLPYYTIEKAFRRIAARAGVRNCTFAHATPLACNNDGKAASANSRVGMAITGHKSHQAYMNYVHADRDQARALADQLSRLADGLAKAEPNIKEMPKHASG